nr:ATP-binding protein [Spirosomataceae bacterium]
MLLKTQIAAVYEAQKAENEKKGLHTRRNYLNNFAPTGRFVEVIAGVRRCGKSTLLGQLMAQTGGNVAYLNFEDARIFGFELSDFQKLDEIIGSNQAAYFFDEIQNVETWEIFVRQLHDRGEKIFITGSNASLLSRDLGTRLTGRHIRHELFPFSYTEFLRHQSLHNSTEAMEVYLEKGGFPEYINLPRVEILQTLLKDIVLRDIAVRYGIRNAKTLMDLTLFLLSNIGKECSYNRLKNTFSIGSANSVSDYLAWLEDAYLLFFLPRFSWSAKSIAINPRKVYAIDNGLVNANSLSFMQDKGRLLENAVFLFLRQRYDALYYFREQKECDFVV